MELLVLLAIGLFTLVPVVGVAYLVWMMASSGRRRGDE